MSGGAATIAAARAPGLISGIVEIGPECGHLNWPRLDQFSSIAGRSK
jgi:hypothetical protein